MMVERNNDGITNGGGAARATCGDVTLLGNGEGWKGGKEEKGRGMKGKGKGETRKERKKRKMAAKSGAMVVRGLP